MNLNQTNTNSRLSRIETLWSIVRQAHAENGQVATSAQQQLLEIYGGAIRRYLLASVGNEDLAEDLFQEFALKFVNGDFRCLDPSRGRFRGFVKTVLYRMIAGHHRKKSRRRELELAHPEQASDDFQNSEEDEKFLISWRDDLLDRTWQRLADFESDTGAPYSSILRLRAAEPTLSSTEMAERMSISLGKHVSPGSTRVTLHRAREKFARLMIDVVTESLDNPTRENIESELIELRLIEYCRDALDAQAPDVNESNV